MKIYKLAAICLLVGAGLRSQIHAELSETNAENSSKIINEFCATMGVHVGTNQWRSEVSKGSSDPVSIIPMANGMEASAVVDPASGQLLSFSTMKTLSFKQCPDSTNLSTVEIAAKMEECFERLGIDTNSLARVISKRFKLAQAAPEMLKMFYWRQDQGFRYKDDYVSFTFDCRDGELLSYKKSWGTRVQAPKVTVTLDWAKSVALKSLGSLGARGSNVKFESAELWVVTPNVLVKAPRSKVSTSERKLAWVLTIPAQQNVKHQEVWVDAETGEHLGGQELI
jgi:hypothetical protein